MSTRHIRVQPRAAIRLKFDEGGRITLIGPSPRGRATPAAAIMNGSDAAPPKNAGCSAPRSSNATTSSRSPWRRTSRLAWSSLSSSVEIFKPPCCSAGLPSFALVLFARLRVLRPSEPPGAATTSTRTPGGARSPLGAFGQGWRGARRGSRCSIRIPFPTRVLLAFVLGGMMAGRSRCYPGSGTPSPCSRSRWRRAASPGCCWRATKSTSPWP